MSGNGILHLSQRKRQPAVAAPDNENHNHAQDHRSKQSSKYNDISKPWSGKGLPDQSLTKSLDYHSSTRRNQLEDCDKIMSEKKQISYCCFSRRVQRYPILNSRAVLVVLTAATTWVIQYMLYRYRILDIGDFSGKAGERSEHPIDTKFDISSYTGPSRTFPIFQHPFPCFPEDKGLYLMLETPANEGFFFQRPLKTGSTTMAGIVMRIAHRKKLPGTRACKHRSYHGRATKYQYGNRTKGKSFLFSILREPTKRSISYFFHFMASIDQEPTDKNFKSAMMSPSMEDMYFLDLAVAPMPLPINNHNKTKVVEEILNAYDFIAVTERMDESLVVLKMLLNLDTEDILYVKERSKGGFSNGPVEKPCIYIIPSFLTDDMKKFFASDVWKKRVEGDELLYKAAYKSLDRTIDALGRKNVEKELLHFQKVNSYAQEKCEPHIQSLCDKGGNRIAGVNTTCYIWGEGCAHDCLDTISIKDLILSGDLEVNNRL